jgi:hypothetical protein
MGEGKTSPKLFTQRNVMAKIDRIESVVVDGKVFVDIERLLAALYDGCIQAAETSNQLEDPVMKIMLAGMTGMCDTIDKIYDVIKKNHGL